MTDPAFRSRMRATMLASMLPEWTPRAACAEKAPNGAPWEVMFDDEPYAKDGAYTLRPKIAHAIAVCTGCPVRMECLTYAIDSERRHEQDYWASELETVKDGRRFGVFGGIPGRIRELFRHDPDPVAACEDWYQATIAVDCATGERTESVTCP